MLVRFNRVAMTVLVSGIVFNALLRYVSSAAWLYVLAGVVFGVNVLAAASHPRLRAGMLPMLPFFAAGLVSAMIAVAFVDWRIAVAGFVGAYAYVAVWLLCLAREHDHWSAIRQYARLHMWLGAATAVIAIFQYFWSPDLLGIMPPRPHTSADLIAQGFTKRATGLIGSPQNLGIYMAIAGVCVALAARTRTARLLLWLPMVVAGGVSGSAAFVFATLMALAAYGCLVAKRSFLRAAALVLLCTIGISGVWMAQGVRGLENLPLVGGLYMGNPLEDRLPYYTDLLVTGSPRELLFGHGLGTASRVSEVLLGDEPVPDVWKPSESHFATIFYEMGLVGFVGFCFIALTALWRCLSTKGTTPIATFVILVMLFSNIAIAPSFSGLTLSAVAWPFILLPVLAYPCRGDAVGARSR